MVSRARTAASVMSACRQGGRPAQPARHTASSHNGRTRETTRPAAGRAGQVVSVRGVIGELRGQGGGTVLRPGKEPEACGPVGRGHGTATRPAQAALSEYREKPEATSARSPCDPRRGAAVTEWVL